MKEKLKYGLAGIIIGGILVWVTVFSINNSNNSSMIGMMGLKNNTNQGIMKNSYGVDAHFIEQMIPHHDEAIEMAEIALEKSTNEDVRTLATNIISSQTKENEQMRIWYADWFGKELQIGEDPNNFNGMGNRGMHMMQGGDGVDMSILENEQDFDKAFVEEMIPHHQMAVMMASMLKAGTQRPEMEQLANEIIEAQTSEIEMMKEWLSNWQ